MGSASWSRSCDAVIYDAAFSALDHAVGSEAQGGGCRPNLDPSNTRTSSSNDSMLAVHDQSELDEDDRSVGVFDASDDVASGEVLGVERIEAD